MIEWIQENWIILAVPTAVFLAFCIVGLWARRVLYNRVDKLLIKSGWGGREVLVQTTRGPFFFWFMLLGAFAAMKFSPLPAEVQVLA